MNPRELVDHIRSGPAKLVLDEPLRFRRRTRSNPCDFNEFLDALQSSASIRIAVCGYHQELGITEDEWVLLVKTLGSIKGLYNLRLRCKAGSRGLYPFKAVADALDNARSLHGLEFGLQDETFPRDPSGVIALSSSLRQHATLKEFTWVDLCSLPDVAHTTPLDPVPRALPACTHIQEVIFMTKYASCDAMKNLLQLQSTAHLHLVLDTEQWLVVTDEIRRGRCNVQKLDLAMHQETISDATKAIKAVTSAIRLDCNLEQLSLQMENGFTDEAGVALAEALTVNKNLRQVILIDSVLPDQSCDTRL
jgi:hypothetical protein